MARTSTTGKEYKFVSKFTKGYRWEPPKIEYEATDEDLTNSGGIGNIVDLFCASPHFEAFRSVLPVRQSNFSYDTAQFGLTVLSSFWFDHECIEDVGEFSFDPGVHTKLSGTPKPRAVGDWFRDFEAENTSGLNDFLIRQSLSLRAKLSPEAPIVIDMDSTSHEQTAKKMEGLGYNHKDEWCLDSLVSFDELGFGYNMDLRGGSTFSAVGAPEMIRRIFKVVRTTESSKYLERYFRADSAFCNEDCIRECLLSDTRFTITMHGNTGWEAKAKAIPNEEWKAWEYSREEIKSSAEKKRPLEKVELATFIYQPGWSENLRFTVVVKRTWEEYKAGSLFYGQGFWRYYAVLTDISQFKFIPQSIMQHHAQRGNSENFIREAKYGYDLRHFPCKKLMANHAYGLLALVAHNFYRAMSLVDNPTRPNFSKLLRRKLVFIPAKLVDHARRLTFKIPRRFMEGVTRFRQAWEAPPPIPPKIRLKAWSTLVLVP